MQNVASSRSQTVPTDECLLRDYIASQDAGAFAAIMWRHGGMVSAVCRRMLWREQDVEDACQATFLVLMRKAPSLSRPNLLGNWLYGVAYRIASKIRQANMRQRTREAPMIDLPAPEADVSGRDLRPALDDELRRLPERYRRPIVLFYLEGKSVEEVASALGRPKGTVLSQLDRARDRLRIRLACRNLAFSAGVLATLLESVAPSDASVPGRLLDWGMPTHAWRLTADGAAAGASAQARQLAQQVLKDMLRRKLWSIGALLLAVLLAVSAGLSSYAAILASPVVVVPADPKSDLESLQGDWQVVAVERNGQILPQDQFPYARLRIQDDLILHQGGALGTVHEMKVRFRLHPEQQPKAIDMQSVGYHTDIYYAIYANEGDTLTICRPEDDNRPTELASKPGSNILLYTAKRIPPAPR